MKDQNSLFEEMNSALSENSVIIVKPKMRKNPGAKKAAAKKNGSLKSATTEPMRTTTAVQPAASTQIASSAQTAPTQTTALTQSAVPVQPVTQPQTKKSTSIRPHPRTSSLDKIYKTLVSGVQKYFSENHFKRGVIGVSGGVDSSLVLKITVDTLGSENITALIMPEFGVTKEENMHHAKTLCNFLGVNFHYQPINGFLLDFAVAPWHQNKLAEMNTKARIRSVLLYNLANTLRALVLGTSNKSELLLGYGTKYGDFAADIEVIGDLLKTEVIQLADHIGLPPEIVNKIPSAELAPNQTDEIELGAAYKNLDAVLAKLGLGEKGCIEHGLDAPLVQMVFRRIKENKHKTSLPFVIRIP